MKTYRVDSISRLKSKLFSGVSVKYFRIPENWPVSIAHETIPQNGKNIPYIVHKKTEEFVYILKGKAKAYLGNKSFNVSSGDYLSIPAGVKHRFVTGKDPIIALSVFCPPMTFSDFDAVAYPDGKIRKINSGKTKRKTK
ncbi:MAG: hypothetical protein A2X28_09805 [Elusimicrobia bacterium GWA2_56_46]|nr:MAG: hypothetical protein A2X28_09805 [Elusimicrobia bacterium GWA2_56_46]OGR54107.1 MAG: hypothetical protein A2X39_03410 [Elusimicrobia bacterium GWC2_56_31]HBB65873.1 hypothetical protein [Elusimicrobiota bacterium]HBW23663.1 hypothetical protein [Elusimicrobiota bacterium]